MYNLVMGRTSIQVSHKWPDNWNMCQLNKPWKHYRDLDDKKHISILDLKTRHDDKAKVPTASLSLLINKFIANIFDTHQYDITIPRHLCETLSSLKSTPFCRTLLSIM